MAVRRLVAADAATIETGWGVEEMAWKPGSDTLATLECGTVRLWKMGEFHNSTIPGKNRVVCLDWSCKGLLAVGICGVEDGQVEVWKCSDQVNRMVMKIELRPEGMIENKE